MRTSRCLTIVEGRERNQRMARQLIEAARRANWATRLIKSVSVTDIAEERYRALFTDYVLWRGLSGPDTSLYGSERMMAYLNATGRVTINTRVVGGLGCTSNKFFQNGLFRLDSELAAHTLPMYRVMNRAHVLKLVEEGKIEYPFVLKPECGTRGEGILLIRKEEDLPEKLLGMSVQPYIKSQYDWRVFVLDGRALGAMRKIGNPDDEADFAAKSGGRQRYGENDAAVLEELFKLAIKAARVSGLDYTGVDLIRDDKTGKYYVLETNFAGGWQNGFLEATGVSVPDEIMKFFEQKYQERAALIS